MKADMEPIHNAMVYIVDDDSSVRDALAWLLRSRRLLSETFASAEAFDARVSQRFEVQSPSCVQSAAALAEHSQTTGLRTQLDGLTERERDVMRLVVGGLPNKLVADQLDISVRTVEVHRARVFEKMGVKSAVELANLLRNL